MSNRHNIDHMIIIKMVIQKWIDDYVSKPTFKVASSVILIDSSERMMKKTLLKIVRFLKRCCQLLPGSHEIEHNDNAMSEHVTDYYRFWNWRKALKDFKSTRKVKCI